MDSQALLLHQVHPAKLGTDITAAAVSTMLLWRHHLWPGLLVRYLKVFEKSNYSSVKWVRYMTRAGSYEIRYVGLNIKVRDIANPA